MVKTNYDFIKNMIGLQGIEVTSTNVNNGVFQELAASSYSFAVCPRCKSLTQVVHDSRCQAIKHLPIWGMPTEILLTEKKICMQL